MSERPTSSREMANPGTTTPQDASSSLWQDASTGNFKPGAPPQEASGPQAWRAPYDATTVPAATTLRASGPAPFTPAYDRPVAAYSYTSAGYPQETAPRPTTSAWQAPYSVASVPNRRTQSDSVAGTTAGALQISANALNHNYNKPPDQQPLSAQKKSPYGANTVPAAIRAGAPDPDQPYRLKK